MMRIAVVAHVRHPIAPPFAGGMEAHSWHLSRHLAARGHDVTLFASGDSAVDPPPGVRIHPMLETHYDVTYPWRRFQGTRALTDYLDAVHAAAASDLATGPFDVIHNNCLHRYIPRLAVAHRLPMVTSLHVPPFAALHRAVHDGAASWTHFTTTSTKQMGRWWPEGAPMGASILPNGIAVEDWPFVPEGDGSAVWSGRITPTKGCHLAARAARIAGIPLTLYGTVEDDGYFRRDVQPLLGGDIVYGGHLQGAELAKRIGRASVMLFTPLWDEPFGLAAIEAMATGVPVACTDMGATREVVGDCGAFAPPDASDALASALLRARAIPRRRCRDRVEQRFSVEMMIDRLESLYSRVRAASRPSRRTAPIFEPFKLRLDGPTM
ncbi:MAG: glycosyltransferase [Pseudomonadota bacterium]